MPIDFSYLEGAAPQEESTPVMSDTANVTIRVDADSMLLCDGEYIDQVFKAGVLTKIQMGPGQHLLEFLYTEDPDIKIEKEVDFPESGKSYLVLIKGLKDLVDAAAAEAKQKAEEEARKKAEEEARVKAEEEAKRIAALREPYVALSNNNRTLTLYYDHLKDDRNGTNLNSVDWGTYRYDVTTVVFDESFANYHDTCSIKGWFRGYTKLTSVIGLNNLDTSNVTDMHWMFYGCGSLKELDLSNFNTSKVTDMSRMFENCESLKELDLSNFNTSKVTDMSCMFENCKSLEELDVSNFDTSMVTDMSCMFEKCKSLEELDVSNFDTSMVTDMSRMFKDCESLEELDVSNFDTSKVTNMRCMFYGCKSLEELDVSDFNTRKVTNMRGMFSYCHLDFPESKFNREEVLDILAAL